MRQIRGQIAAITANHNSIYLSSRSSSDVGGKKRNGVSLYKLKSEIGDFAQAVCPVAH